MPELSKEKKQVSLHLSELEMERLIGKKFPPPAWTVLTQLRDSTGWAGKGQTADAFAFGTWPSRGFQILGFEIKSYRSDWLRELKRPDKADGLARYCDNWWLITNIGVAKPEEIPATWGWMEATAKGLVTRQQPEKMKTEPIQRVFLMSIMRNLENNYMPKRLVKEEVEKKVAEELTTRRDDNQYALDSLRDDMKDLRKKVNDFEQASGIKIADRWGDKPKHIGEIVKAVMDSRLKYYVRDIQQAASKTKEVLDTLHKLPLFSAEREPHA